MIRPIFLYALGIALLAATGLQISGCANIIPPEGGFKDTLSPVLIRATPPDSTRNFSGNRITLTFDEYVQLDNFFQNAMLSPVPRVPPTATNKLTTVTIRLRDSLEANTTYSINFGNSIKDVNEGNVAKNLTYVFSTGSYIDSMEFEGNVILAETGKVDSTLVVILHRSARDSSIITERPRYMSKLDGRGNFRFVNLPAGTFYVYAMKDDARSLRYTSNRQLFAFADSPVVVSQQTPKVTLFAYQEVKAAPATGTTTTNTNDRRLKFSTSIENDKHDLLKPFVITFDRPLRQFDSSKIMIATDSVFTPLTGYRWTRDTSGKKITLVHTWRENTNYHVILGKEFATDTLGQQIPRQDTLTFLSMATGDYGKLTIRFRNLDMAKNPVLQFVQSDVVVAAYPLTSQVFSQPLVLPGEYELRILEDANRNGIWDPGVFFGRRRQPELVKPIERTINVKANWENQMEIAL